MSRTTGYLLQRTHSGLGGTLISRIFARLGDRFRLFSAINELEQLSDRQLRDIGLERRQIAEVAEREIAGLRTR